MMHTRAYKPWSKSTTARVTRTLNNFITTSYVSRANKYTKGMFWITTSLTRRVASNCLQILWRGALTLTIVFIEDEYSVEANSLLFRSSRSLLLGLAIF